MARPEIEEVFTPRNSIVNAEMYVERPKLEDELLVSVRGSMHTVLFGESGNGKSWLYKHLFAREKIEYVVANCGNASRLNSLTNEIFRTCLPSDYLSKVKIEDLKEATAKAVIAEGKLSSKNIYDLHKDEPLLAAFKYLASQNKKTILVIDNLEAIVSRADLIDELCNIILLIDDERYASCGVKFLIVGTPNGVVDFFGKSSNLASIVNRVEEITKVSGLDLAQITDLLMQGFVQKLKVSFQPGELDKLATQVLNVTLGIAQRAQELCVSLALCMKDNSWVFEPKILSTASFNWLMKGLRGSYVVIESHLNSKETTVGRRNQVIYAIGRLNKNPFYSSEIEAYIRKEFPETVPETNMGIGSILSELSDTDKPIIKKNDKGTFYAVMDPLFIMCIRLMLIIDKQSKKVIRRTFKTS